MKFVLAALLLAGLPALAANIQPAVGNKSCLAREYDQPHMRAHKGQLLRTLVVIIENFPANKDYPENYQTAKVIGEHNGRLFGNEAGCTYESDGSLNCQIDCDGGAFSVKAEGPGAALFQVKKDYYFPLFIHGTNYEDPKPGQVVNLDYSDSENRTYKLFDADVKSCEQEWRRYEAEDHGC